MTDKSNLKTFFVSIGAVKLEPGINIVEQEPGLSIGEVDITNPSGRFAVASAHCPRLLVRHEETEAREAALHEARQLFPEDDGWTNHAVCLNEIPRSMFIEMQLFITAREVWSRLLRLTGFRAIT